MKLVSMVWHNGYIVYGYSLPDTPEGSVWRSLRLYPETWHIPMARDTYLDGV